MMGAFELRWLIRQGWEGSEKVLQYRSIKYVTDYSSKDQISTIKWTKWQDVPKVEDGVDTGTED
jgi:hypothetical protein